jgi:hypothetical protein
MSKLSSRLQPAHRGHRQSHLSHHAARVTRVLVGCATVAIAIPLTAGSDPGVALAAVRPAQVTDYGSFRLSGPVSGTLVPLATTCDASTSAADVEFSWFGKVTTLKGVSSKSIVSLELDLQGSSYGRKGALENTGGNPPFLTYSATANGSGLASSWQSVSGTYSTSKGGVSGTLAVVLDQADGHPGRLVIKGSWEHCRRGGNI